MLETEIAQDRLCAIVDVFDTVPLRDTSKAISTHSIVLLVPYIG